MTWREVCKARLRLEREKAALLLDFMAADQAVREKDREMDRLVGACEHPRKKCWTGYEMSGWSCPDCGGQG